MEIEKFGVINYKGFQIDLDNENLEKLKEIKMWIEKEIIEKQKSL